MTGGDGGLLRQPLFFDLKTHPARETLQKFSHDKIEDALIKLAVK
jgi:hypothetical protein